MRKDNVHVSLGKDLYGIYRGVVVDNVDPLKVGRIKVRVFNIHGKDDVPDENLPWASYCVPYGSANSGAVIIPEINNTVFIMFEGGDKQYPVYLGVCYGTGKEKPYEVGRVTGRMRAVRSKFVEKPVEALNNDIKVLYKSPKGNLIIMDDTDCEEASIHQDAMGQTMIIKSPIKKPDSKDNHHLESALYNINITKKKHPGIEKLKRDAFVILEGLSKAYSKIVTKPSGSSYIESKVREVILKLVDKGDFFLQSSVRGISYKDGVLTISAPEVVISAKEVHITSPRVKIDGFVTINDVHMFDIIGHEGAKMDINQGGNKGSDVHLEELETEYHGL